MEVVTLQVFVSLMLAVGSILLFAIAFRQRDFEHADRLALLPLEPSEPRQHGEQTPKKDDKQQ